MKDGAGSEDTCEDLSSVVGSADMNEEWGMRRARTVCEDGSLGSVSEDGKEWGLPVKAGFR